MRNQFSFIDLHHLRSVPALLYRDQNTIVESIKPVKAWPFVYGKRILFLFKKRNREQNHRWPHWIIKHGVLHKSKEMQEKDPFELFPQGSGPCQTNWRITKDPSTPSTKSGAPVPYPQWHYNDVILGSMASRITSLTIVYSAVNRAQIK